MSVPTVETVEAAAYRVPTASPEETDGTLAWSATTLVVVEAAAGGRTGLGYTYAHAAAAELARGELAEVVRGRSALSVEGPWRAMQDAVRNLGRPGLAPCAISAVDAALWDLKARLLDVALSTLLGRVREGVPVYGSGGFCSYTETELRAQLGGWVEEGLRMVKMKVGRHPDADPGRVRAARREVGDEVGLFVDANGAYARKQALAMAERFADAGVRWLEEPVSSDDLEGLRLVRDRAPAGMDVAAGEYAYDAFALRRLLEAEAVDVLQADATRCLGLTGFLRAHALAESRPVPLSAHTAPQLHAHACVARPGIVHLEHFFDHVRIERALFDGVLEPRDGELRPDPARPGNGLAFRRADAERYRVRASA